MGSNRSSFDPNAAACPDSGIFGLPPISVDDARVVVVPVPYAATASYGGGAERGPAAILAASRQVDLSDRAMGRPYEAGITMHDLPGSFADLHRKARPHAEIVIRAGGLVAGDEGLKERVLAVNVFSHAVDGEVFETVDRLLVRGKCVALVGGDHSVSYGAIRAHAAQYRGMGILQVDAHADLRPAYEGFHRSHASIMHNVLAEVPNVARLVQVGIRDFGEAEHDAIQAAGDRICAFCDDDLADGAFRGMTWEETVASIVGKLPQQVYITVDIDGLDPSLCPHTGTPVPGGLSFREVVALIRAVARSRRIVGVDLTEVVPGPPGDEWDANVGARLLYKLIGWMLVSQVQS